jgi:hypothetical protein
MPAFQWKTSPRATLLEIRKGYWIAVIPDSSLLNRSEELAVRPDFIKPDGLRVLAHQIWTEEEAAHQSKSFKITHAEFSGERRSGARVAGFIVLPKGKVSAEKPATARADTRKT